MTNIRVIQNRPVIRITEEATNLRVVRNTTSVIVRETQQVIRVGQNRTRVLRIAAVGPQGPQGPQGPVGPAGSTTIQGVSAETISALRIIYFDAAGARVASAADFSQVTATVGIATSSAASSGQIFNYQVAGELFDASWNWNEGASLFLSDSGLLSETPGTHVRIIATVVSPQTININLLQPIRR